jgi:single-stranded DNA-binding protein
MNQCILMAEIIQAPQLRYTSDNQTPVTEFVVQFQGVRADDPPSKLKVVGWGNLAQEIQQNYQEGDRIVLEGRLSMVNVDRPEGFKEKRAEMTVQRLHRLEGASLTTHESTPGTYTAPATATPSAPPSPVVNTPPAPAGPSAFAPPAEEPDYDDIPF